MIRYYFKNNCVHPPRGLNTFDIKSGFFNVSDTKETHLHYKGRGDLLCNASPTKETLRLCVAQLHMHALKIHKSALKATSDNSYMLEIFLMEHKNVPGMISDTTHVVINL